MEKIGATFIFSLALALFCCSTVVECSPKLSCNSTSGCTDTSETCEDGVCECREGYSIGYSSSLKPLCRKDDNCTSGCNVSQECAEDVCRCKAGRQNIDGYCKIANISHFGESCNNFFRATVCDIEENLECINRSCICIKSHYLHNNVSCRSKSEYMTENNITEYKVKPGFYCRTSNDCISGLVCYKSYCKCPGSCEYIAEKEVCDCGADDVNRWGPGIVGAFLSCCIIRIWWEIIKCTTV